MKKIVDHTDREEQPVPVTKKANNNTTIIVVVVLLVVAIGLYILYNHQKSQDNGGTN